MANTQITAERAIELLEQADRLEENGKLHEAEQIHNMIRQASPFGALLPNFENEFTHALPTMENSFHSRNFGNKPGNMFSLDNPTDGRSLRTMDMPFDHNSTIPEDLHMGVSNHGSIPESENPFLSSEGLPHPVGAGAMPPHLPDSMPDVPNIDPMAASSPISAPSTSGLPAPDFKPVETSPINLPKAPTAPDLASIRPETLTEEVSTPAGPARMSPADADAAKTTGNIPGNTPVVDPKSGKVVPYGAFLAGAALAGGSLMAGGAFALQNHGQMPDLNHMLGGTMGASGLGLAGSGNSSASSPQDLAKYMILTNPMMRHYIGYATSAYQRTGNKEQALHAMTEYAKQTGLHQSDILELQTAFSNYYK